MDTALQQLTAYIEHHKYLRGDFVGDAPADHRRRGKTHFRVVHRPHRCTAVRFHSTDILQAYPNGDIVLDTCGWYNRTTTRSALQDALRLVQGYGVSFGSVRKYGVCTPTVTTPHGVYQYYDGIRITADGYVITSVKPFQRRQLNATYVAQLKANLKASGFTTMFPLLYSQCAPDTPRWAHARPAQLQAVLSNPDQAAEWAKVIHLFKYDIPWGSPPEECGDAKSCWTRIMGIIKSDMYEVVDTDVFNIRVDGVPV